MRSNRNHRNLPEVIQEIARELAREMDAADAQAAEQSLRAASHTTTAYAEASLQGELQRLGFTIN